MYCENKRCILYQETSLVPTIVGDYKKVTNNNNSDNVSFFYLTNLLLDRWDPHTCSVSADLDAIICLSNYSFLCRVFYLASPIPYICPEHTFWVTANQSLQDEINASKAHVSTDTKLWNFGAGRDLKSPQVRLSCGLGQCWNSLPQRAGIRERSLEKGKIEVRSQFKTLPCLIMDWLFGKINKAANYEVRI